MRDRHGRLINYMRISVTDKCNLRCRYCMPEGASDISSAAHCSFDSVNDISGQMLTFDEILRIAQASVKAGDKQDKTHRRRTSDKKRHRFTDRKYQRD